MTLLNKSNKRLTKNLEKIFINAKDYNPDFVRLTEHELQTRNINLDTSKQLKEKVKQIDKRQLEQGKAGSPLYIFFSFVLALLGGLIAIYAGYIYSQSKIKTTEGEVSMFMMNRQDNLVEFMMWLGVAIFLFLLFRQLFTT